MWREELTHRLETTKIFPPTGTLYFTLAEELLSMASSYLTDGDYFTTKGNTVDAIAAFSYALGWLDISSCLGLVTFQRESNQWLFLPIEVPERENSRLRKKTVRYREMLGSALVSIVPAPERGTCMEFASQKIILACTVLQRFGDRFGSLGMLENALGSYSNAHAWLDAGIRTGLFRVTGNHALFAV